MNSSGGEWTTKKVAIDAVYSMAAIIKEEILPFKSELMRALNGCRFDKIKPVREATLETIKLLKEIGGGSDAISTEEDQVISANDSNQSRQNYGV